ncbi:MAG TPA: DUF4381 domain-containing protein [Crenotrichaceae bacterium]|nr:DUF4381 domain-containing protein [Crenotrichaceae bacterium]
MEQPSLPLKDIHLPQAVSWWPLAPGWWILVLLCGLVFLCWYYRNTLRAWLAPGIGKTASRQLNKITSNQRLSTQQKIQGISQLLRQTAMSLYPRDQVAGLAGQQWLRFLDGDDPQKPFSNGAGRCLTDAPYRPDSELDLDAVVDLARSWIKQNKRRHSNHTKTHSDA